MTDAAKAGAAPESDAEITALKAAAEAATPGPWEATLASESGDWCEVVADDATFIYGGYGAHSALLRGNANAAFIAAANPAVILALLAERDALLAERTAARALRDAVTETATGEDAPTMLRRAAHILFDAGGGPAQDALNALADAIDAVLAAQPPANTERAADLRRRVISHLVRSETEENKRIRAEWGAPAMSHLVEQWVPVVLDALSAVTVESVRFAIFDADNARPGDGCWVRAEVNLPPDEYGGVEVNVYDADGKCGATLSIPVKAVRGPDNAALARDEAGGPG